jgi:small subunit ribosomal protein S7
MSRRRRAFKRETIPDAIYGDIQVTKFINRLMQRGKKSTAESIFYGALDIVKEKTKEPEPIKIFMKALDNVKPLLEVKSRRVGGATYQVPVDVAPDRRNSLAMKWIAHFASAKKGRPMSQRLADEIIDASKGTGSSVKKKEDTHKMAEANRAFAHYKW